MIVVINTIATHAQSLTGKSEKQKQVGYRETTARTLDGRIIRNETKQKARGDVAHKLYTQLLRIRFNTFYMCGVCVCVIV